MTVLAGARAGDQGRPDTFPALEVGSYRVAVSPDVSGQVSDITLPAGQMVVRFSPRDALQQPLRRYRCKLEGRDGDWRQPSSDMRLVVMFFDARSEWISDATFVISGESPGWRGTVNGSPLVARSDVVSIPEKAAEFSIILTSAGPPDTLGTLALGGLTVSRCGLDGVAKDTVFQMAISPPEPGRADLAPPGWVKGGQRRSMAQVLRADTAPAGLMLAIVDEDPVAHGEWQTVRRLIKDRGDGYLRVDWLLSYSISKALDPAVIYERLPPGRYVLRFQALMPAGQPCSEEHSASLVVLPPLWQRSWFLGLCGFLAAAGALGVIRYVWWRRARREIARLQQQAVLDAERMRIARDIHDDLGSTLAQISMLSQSADPGTASAVELAESLTTINQAAKEMTQAMDEIVWAVNPGNDRLDRLVMFLASHAHAFLRAAGIDCVLDHPEPVPDWPLPAPARHNLFMAFKEALANAAVHSGCRRIHVTLTIDGRILGVVVEDDGRGFAAVPEPAVGNGLTNMRRRIESIGGRFGLESVPGKGTRVAFEVPLEG